MDQVKCVKDEEDMVLIKKKDRLKKYFYNLFNKGYEILSHSNNLAIK